MLLFVVVSHGSFAASERASRRMGDCKARISLYRGRIDCAPCVGISSGRKAENGFTRFEMKLIFILLTAALSGCVTRATIYARTCIVTVSPSVEIKATPLP